MRSRVSSSCRTASASPPCRWTSRCACGICRRADSRRAPPLAARGLILFAKPQAASSIPRPHGTPTVYRPAKDKDTGAAVVIAPGGGYNLLAFDKEGEEVAEWLNSIGVTGVVLKYRVPRRPETARDVAPPQALMDAQRAISFVRSK